MSITFDAKVALEQFRKRKADNANTKHVNNAASYAGEPMYYYCDACRVHTETLPESHILPAKRVCDPCRALIDHGLITRDGQEVR
jgi:hypothetical protein